MEQEQDYLYVESVKAIKEGEIDPSNWNSEELIQFLKQNNIKKSLNAFEKVSGKDFLESRSVLEFKIDSSEKDLLNKSIVFFEEFIY